jgi:hypothetical protein
MHLHSGMHRKPTPGRPAVALGGRSALGRRPVHCAAAAAAEAAPKNGKNVVVIGGGSNPALVTAPCRLMGRRVRPGHSFMGGPAHQAG